MATLKPVYEISRRIGIIEWHEELIGPNMAKEDLEAIMDHMAQIRRYVLTLSTRGVITDRDEKYLRDTLDEPISAIRNNLGHVKNPYALYESTHARFKAFVERWEDIMTTRKLATGTFG